MSCKHPVMADGAFIKCDETTDQVIRAGSAVAERSTNTVLEREELLARGKEWIL